MGQPPGASTETRKKIIRLLVKEIIADVVDDSLAPIIHWQGGDHTRLIVKKNKVGQTRWTTEGGTGPPDVRSVDRRHPQSRR